LVLVMVRPKMFIRNRPSYHAVDTGALALRIRPLAGSDVAALA
jgi:hypothetical protein